MIGPSDLLLVVPHIYAVSPFSLMGGLQKCQYGSEKIVLQGHHILSTAGDAPEDEMEAGLHHELHCCCWLEGAINKPLEDKK